jgi:hypothetical protein
MLSFNLMSKRIREESKPVLYETIAVYDRPQSGRQGYLDAAHYVKSVQNFYGTQTLTVVEQVSVLFNGRYIQEEVVEAVYRYTMYHQNGTATSSHGRIFR